MPLYIHPLVTASPFQRDYDMQSWFIYLFENKFHFHLKYALTTCFVGFNIAGSKQQLEINSSKQQLERN